MSAEAWDPENGEIRILGRRQVAIDAQTFCTLLDSLVGVQVGEVIMHNLRSRLGKIAAAELMKDMPGAKLGQLIDHLIKSERKSGIGETKVTLPESPISTIQIEVTNPAVKGPTGAAKSFVFSWWAGALSSLLGKECDIKNLQFTEGQNMITCRINPR